MIKLVYRKLTHVSLLNIKAQRVSVLSSSWEFFDKVPLKDILKAAVWNQSSTLQNST